MFKATYPEAVSIILLRNEENGLKIQSRNICCKIISIEIQGLRHQHNREQIEQILLGTQKQECLVRRQLNYNGDWTNALISSMCLDRMTMSDRHNGHVREMYA